MANREPKTDQLLVEQYGVDHTPYEDELEQKIERQKAYERYRLLWQKRRWLGKLTLWGLAISLLIAFLIPSEYESTAQLMPPGQSGGGMGMIAALAGQGGGAARALAGLGGMLGGKTSGDLYVGVLSSRTVEDDLITKFDLRKVYGKKRWEDARKKLDSRTDMSVDKKSELIKIVVTDRDPRRAKDMAQEYVDELNRLMTQLDTSSSHRERVFLEDRLGQVKKDLEEAEKVFSQFASNNLAVNIPEQSKATLEASSQLEGQLIAAETELQGLKQIYTDNNIRVRTTQARVAEIQHQLEILRGASGGADSSGTNDAGASLYPSVRKLPLLGVNYADLLRNSKVEEAVFEALTQQYEAAKVDEAKDLPIAKVLDAPEIPEKKSFPPRAIITTFGAIFALSMGIAWIIMSERWRKVDPSDPAKSFFTGVAADVAHELPWVARNGSSNGARTAPEGATDSPSPENGRGDFQGTKRNGDS